MEAIATASISNNSQETDSKKPGDKAPDPKVGFFERTLRLIAVPFSAAVGYYYLHSQSREGVQKFYHERGKLEELQKAIDIEFAEAKKSSAGVTIAKEVSRLHQKFERGVTDIMHRDGFTNTLKYFNGNSHRGKLAILLTSGAAISITMGFLFSISDPRNREAFGELFHRVNRHAKEHEQGSQR